MTIDKAYADLLSAPSDMRDHLPKLKEIAAGRRVIEFGTRRGVSTVALLAGRPRSLITYDIIRTQDVDKLEKMAAEADIPFEFRNEDIEKLDEVPACTCGFVDAMHNADSVAQYLVLLFEAGASLIALHDTASFKHAGDLPGTRGVYDAVEDFIRAFPEWRITYHTDACYGFTVIENQ